MAVARCQAAATILKTPLRHLQIEERRCAAIINAQLSGAPDAATGSGSPSWLIPEPWSGHLGIAPILFVGQNPSADHREDYPTDVDGTISRSDEALFAFFEGRFNAGTRGGISDGSRVQHKDGRLGRSNLFLARVKALASEILGRDTVPGRDYAITDAVRCKVSRSAGVEFALDACSERYLATTLRLSSANVIVCLGVQARKAVCRIIGLPNEDLRDAVEWNGREIAFLAHSNARPSTRARRLSPDQVEVLRRRLER